MIAPLLGPGCRWLLESSCATHTVSNALSLYVSLEHPTFGRNFQDSDKIWCILGLRSVMIQIATSYKIRFNSIQFN